MIRFRQYNSGYEKELAHKYYLDYYDLLVSYLPFVRRIFVKLYIPDTLSATSNVHYLPQNIQTLADIIENKRFNNSVPKSNPDQGLVHSPYSLTGIRYHVIYDFPMYLIDAGVANNPLRISDTSVAFETSNPVALLFKYERTDLFPGINTFTDAIIEFAEEGIGRRYKIVGESKYSAFGNIIDTLYQCNLSLLLDEFNPMIAGEYVYNRTKNRIVPMSIHIDIEQCKSTVETFLTNYRLQHRYNIPGILDNKWIPDIAIVADVLGINLSQIGFSVTNELQHTLNILKTTNLSNYNSLANAIVDNTYDTITCYIYPATRTIPYLENITHSVSISDPTVYNTAVLGSWFDLSSVISTTINSQPQFAQWIRILKCLLNLLA